MTSSILDTRKTYIQLFNETRRKLGVNEISTLGQDTLGMAMIDYMNDVITEISDFGDWQEMYREESFAFTTANSSTSDWVFNTSVATKNIHEIQFGSQIAPLWLVTLDDIRRLNRVKAYGVPTQFALVGVDNVVTGNPRVRVFPTPTTAQASANFNVAYYKKPALITTADTSSIPEFPSRMIAQGLLAYTLRDEERGNQSQEWQQEYTMFKKYVSETYNRFNGDTGSDTFFVPPRGRRGR